MELLSEDTNQLALAPGLGDTMPLEWDGSGDEGEPVGEEPVGEEPPVDEDQKGAGETEVTLDTSEGDEDKSKQGDPS